MFSHGGNGHVSTWLWKSFRKALNISEQFRKTVKDTWRNHFRVSTGFSKMSVIENISTLIKKYTPAAHVLVWIHANKLAYDMHNFQLVHYKIWYDLHTHTAIITTINKDDKLRLMKGAAVTDQFNCQPWWLLSPTSVFIQGYHRALKCY